MKVKVLSNVVKFLISILIFFSFLMVVFVLPIYANQVGDNFPELLYLKTPLLLISQFMMFLFIAGLVVILYLIYLFDQGRTFTKEFTQKVNWLAIMCGVAVLFIVIVFFILAAEGGPGPGYIWMGAIALIITILAFVLVLISTIINQAIEYKEENELTV